MTADRRGLWLVVVLGLAAGVPAALAQKTNPKKADPKKADPKKVEPKKDDLGPWRAQVGSLKVEEQVKAVEAKLIELNPEFRGQNIRAKVVDGVVTELTVPTGYVTDARPVQAFKDLTVLNLNADNAHHSKVADLSYLSGMRLTELRFEYTSVADLTPLKGMPIKTLCFLGTRVTDVAVLKDMPLEAVTLAAKLNGAQVVEVLRDKPLTWFMGHDLGLTPARMKVLFAKAKLAGFDVAFDSGISSLEALRGMPLHRLAVAHARFLTSIEPIKGAADVAFVRFNDTPVADLEPLRGKAKLEILEFHGCRNVKDIKPLAECPALRSVALSDTAVTDLGPLAGREALHALGAGNLRLKSLKPLAGLPKLSDLYLKGTQVGDKDYVPLTKLPALEEVSIDLTPGVKAALKKVPTLKRVNGQAAADVLK